MAQSKTYIGNLNRRITIQRRTVTVDSHGGRVESFTDLATVWASLEHPATGSGEAMSNALQIATQNTVFVIWKRDIEYTDRISYGGNVYDITRIAELGLNQYLQITAERRV